MEQLIKELNDPANQSSSNRIQHIQRQIQLLQRQKSGWPAGFELLSHEQQVVRFYGALTLTIKINADWENDGLVEDKAAREALMENLISSYVQLTSIPDGPLVLKKLCSTLTAYFVQQSSDWKHPVRHLLFSLLQGQYIRPENIPGSNAILQGTRSINFHQLQGLFWFASTLVEDATRLELNSITNAPLVERLCSSGSDVWQLIFLCLQSFLNKVINQHFHSLDSEFSLSIPEDQHLEILKTILPMSTLWLQFLPVIPEAEPIYTGLAAEELVSSCITMIFDCFAHKSLADLAIQTLTTIAQSYPHRFRKVGADYVTKITSSAQAAAWIIDLEEGQPDPEAVRYVEFLVALVNLENLSSSDYFLQNRISGVLQTLQKLIPCPGAAVIDDEVSPLILECMNDIVENYNDWAGDGPADDIMKSFIRELCIAVMKKAQYPAQEMDVSTQTWDPDDRANFLGFRTDVHDFFYAAFGSIGPSLIGALAGDITRIESQEGWPAFEGRLFCLDAFSHTMEDDPDHYDPIIYTIMSTRQWAMATQYAETAPTRARQACIRFIGHSTGYISRHTNVLVSCLEFLFSSLQVDTFSNQASRAVQTLCFEQRSILIGALPQFLNSLSNLADLGAAERHRVYSSVAAIVQATLVEEDKLKPLMQILDIISHMFAATREQLSSNVEEAKSWSVDLMETLAAVGKGLRAPTDVAIDLECSDSLQGSFWTSGEGRSVQERALAICISTLQASEMQSDGEIVEAACDFIKSGYTEEDPSPFKFAPGISVDFLTSQINLQCSKIDAVMNCASAFLSSAKLDSLGPSLETVLTPIFANYQVLMTQKQMSGSLPETDFPSSTLEFLTRLLPKWGPQWLSSQNAQDSLAITFEIGLAVLSATDTLPRRSAASFFAAVVDYTGPAAKLGELATKNLSHSLYIYSPRLIGLLLRLLAGECARSEIEALTEPLTKVVLRQTPNTRKILREAMRKDSDVLKPKALEATNIEERLRFVAQIEGLRGARKTTEVVRDFWLKCRGGAFGYVT